MCWGVGRGKGDGDEGKGMKDVGRGVKKCVGGGKGRYGERCGKVHGVSVEGVKSVLG